MAEEVMGVDMVAVVGMAAITIAGVMTTLGIETMMIVEEIMMIAGGDIEGHTSCSVFRLEYNKSRIYLRSLLPQQNNVIFTD
mmetsp:Transcript_7735/g.10299  ORF Transcript_7735/g.10299 Transcript_7735/m.10299 type:complete len:82 (+) Transcript_7735:835-1080(+)